MKTNKEIMEKYETLRLEEVTPITWQNQKNIINKLNRFLEKPFKKTTEDDILKFLSTNKLKLSSKDTYKGIIIPFYKWIFDWEYGEKLPTCIKNIKKRKKRQRERDINIDSADRKIKPENYKKLIKTANMKEKAILETFNTFGIRRAELRSINADGIKEYGKPKWHLKLTVRDSKTKPRIVPIEKNEYPQFLLSYWQQHPFKNQKEKPLFYSKIDKKGNPVRYSLIALTRMVQRLCKQANTEIHTPHDFRHTAISRDRPKGMPDTFISEKYGLVKGSTQIKTYDDNGNNELTKYILENSDNKNQPETIDKIKKDRDKLLEMKDEIKILKQKYGKEFETLKFMVNALGIVNYNSSIYEYVDEIDGYFIKIRLDKNDPEYLDKNQKPSNKVWVGKKQHSKSIQK